MSGAREVRMDPAGELVAIRRGDNDWRVSNGGHYRDIHVADWTPMVPAAAVSATRTTENEETRDA